MRLRRCRSPALLALASLGAAWRRPQAPSRPAVDLQRRPSARPSSRTGPGRRRRRARPEQPRFRQSGGHRARPAAVLRHAPVRRRQRVVRAPATTRPRRSRTAASRSVGPRAASTATPSRSPTCGSTAGSAGPAPPTACGRRASGRSSTTRSSALTADASCATRLAADPSAAAAYAQLFGSAVGRRPAGAGARQRRQGAGGLPGDDHHRRARPSTISATRWSAATCRPWPAIRWPRSAA